MAKNPLITRPTKQPNFSTPERQSMGIFDDYAVRKVVNTKEGTVEKVPTANKDIVNKEFITSIIGTGGTYRVSFWNAAGTALTTDSGFTFDNVGRLTVPSYIKFGSMEFYKNNNETCEFKSGSTGAVAIELHLSNGTNVGTFGGRPANTFFSKNSSQQFRIEDGNRGNAPGYNLLAFSAMFGKDQNARASGHLYADDVFTCIGDAYGCISYSDMSSCQSQDGCTWNANQPCSEFNNEVDCSNYVPYGCTANYFDCTMFTNSGDCDGHSGCTSNYYDCSQWNNDEVSCTAHILDGCSYNDPDCTGGNFTDCSGFPFDNCSGMYNICTGAATECSSYTDSTNCSNQDGCTPVITEGFAYFNEKGQQVMKSPDGNCWDCRPDNSGTMTCASITCP